MRNIFCILLLLRLQVECNAIAKNQTEEKEKAMKERYLLNSANATLSFVTEISATIRFWHVNSPIRSHMLFLNLALIKSSLPENLVSVAVIVSSMQNFTEPENPVQKQIRKEFKEVGEKLDQMMVASAKSFDAISNQITVMGRFKRKMEKVQNLMEKLQRWIDEPNEINRENLTNSCTENSMLEVINTLAEEILFPDLYPDLFSKTLTQEKEREKVFSLMKLVASIFLEASMLHQSCIGEHYCSKSEAQLNSTIEKDAAKLAKKYESIFTSLKTRHEKVSLDFLRKAKETTLELMKKEEKMNQKDFAKKLYSTLKLMYNLHVAVVSFDGSGKYEEDWKVWSYDNNLFFLENKYGRSVFVVLLRRSRIKNFDTAVNSCLTNKTLDLVYNSLGKLVVNELESCLQEKKFSLSGIIVARGNISLAVEGKGKNFVYSDFDYEDNKVKVNIAGETLEESRGITVIGPHKSGSKYVHVVVTN